LRHSYDHQPIIGNTTLDLFFFGDLLYQGKGCSNIKDDKIHFLNKADVSQIVIGESAFTCYCNQLAKSKIGKLDMNTHYFNSMF
jgi:hypothetical protein